MTIERLAAPEALNQVEPLIFEYGRWVVEHLLADCGVRIDPAELERLHDHFLASCRRSPAPGDECFWPGSTVFPPGSGS